MLGYIYLNSRSHNGFPRTKYRHLQNLVPRKRVQCSDLLVQIEINVYIQIFELQTPHHLAKPFCVPTIKNIAIVSHQI